MYEIHEVASPNPTKTHGRYDHLDHALRALSDLAHSFGVNVDTRNERPLDWDFTLPDVEAGIASGRLFYITRLKSEKHEEKD
jgi:hypothetical protein